MSVSSKRGSRSLAEAFPEIAAELHPTKNGYLTADQVSFGSHKELWWYRKECRHEWHAPVYRRTGKQKVGCATCHGTQVMVGVTDLPTTHFEISTEWHPTLNDLEPEQVSAGSKYMAHWLGKHCGHTWPAMVQNRALNDSGCSVCSGRTILSGFNDLLTLQPLLAAEWHPTKNDVGPETISPNSHKKYWWLGQCGHSWPQSPNQRLNGGWRGCPVCLGRLVVPGINDLAFRFPLVAAELHPDNPFKAIEVAAYSNKRAHWLCAKGHDWYAPVSARTNMGTQCVECNKYAATSRAEEELTVYLESLGHKVDRNRRGLITSNWELDMHVPVCKIAVEYNGLYWHSDALPDSPGGVLTAKERHRLKYESCKAAGITLIQIWEDDWNAKAHVVKSMLAHRLESPSYFADELRAKEIPAASAHAFFEHHHLDGDVEDATYLGLLDKQKVVVAALALGSIDEGKCEVLRYAEATRIRSGLRSLLMHAQSRMGTAQYFATVDHCRAEAEIYEKSGFKVASVLAPEASYVVRNRRSKSLNANRKSDKPVRIWDAGATRYEISLTES